MRNFFRIGFFAIIAFFQCSAMKMPLTFYFLNLEERQKKAHRLVDDFLCKRVPCSSFRLSEKDCVKRGFEWLTPLYSDNNIKNDFIRLVKPIREYIDLGDYSRVYSYKIPFFILFLLVHDVDLSHYVLHKMSDTKKDFFIYQSFSNLISPFLLAVYLDDIDMFKNMLQMLPVNHAFDAIDNYYNSEDFSAEGSLLCYIIKNKNFLEGKLWIKALLCANLYLKNQGSFYIDKTFCRNTGCKKCKKEEYQSIFDTIQSLCDCDLVSQNIWYRFLLKIEAIDPNICGSSKIESHDGESCLRESVPAYDFIEYRNFEIAALCMQHPRFIEPGLNAYCIVTKNYLPYLYKSLYKLRKTILYQYLENFSDINMLNIFLNCKNARVDIGLFEYSIDNQGKISYKWETPLMLIVKKPKYFLRHTKWKDIIERLVQYDPLTLLQRDSEGRSILDMTSNDFTKESIKELIKKYEYEHYQKFLYKNLENQKLIDMAFRFESMH